MRIGLSTVMAAVLAICSNASPQVSVALRVVDQNDQEIPDSEIHVLGVSYPTGATATLPVERLRPSVSRTKGRRSDVATAAPEGEGG